MQNFLMNFVAVTGTNLFLKRYQKSTRLLIVTFIHSVLGLCCLLFFHNFTLYRLVTHFLLNSGMVFLCFGKCTWREFLENWTVVYLVIIVCGGVMQWLMDSGICQHSFLLQVLLLCFVGYGILLYLMHKRTFANHLYLVQMKKDDRRMEVKGYWDSGNQLWDPYTGQEISILSSRKAREFLDEERDRIRYVPYQSLGQQNGLIKVTNIDEMILYDGKKTIHRKEMAIGIANDGLMEQKGYDLILHSSLL